ncbi:MAG: helix-turn-helix domain-containing protein [Geminicoccaceae bacterium]
MIDAAATARGTEKPRLIAIAYVLRGYSPVVAAAKAKLSKGRLRDWIPKFNEKGIQGLRNVPRPRSQTLTLRTDIPAQEVRQAAKTVEAKAQAPLLGIADVLDGRGRLASALKFGACPSSMTNWVHRFNRAGIDGLVRTGRIGKKAKLRPDIPVATVRRAARKTRRGHIKRRLEAIGALLVVDDRPKVAREMGVSEASIKLWIFSFNKNGLAGLGYQEPVTSNIGNAATPNGLRQLALKTHRKVGKRRLLGMAKMMEGADIRQVAAEANVSRASVEGWTALFATKGVEGLIYGPSQINR